MMDWTVAVACSTFFFSVAWLGSAFIWSRVHIKELEVEQHATELHSYALRDDVKVLKQDVGALTDAAETPS